MKKRVKISSHVRYKSFFKTCQPILGRHIMNKDKKVERYEMPGDFLLNFDNFPKEIYAAPTKGKLTEIIDYIPPALNRAEFMRRFSPTAVSMLDIMKEYLTNLFKR